MSEIIAGFLAIWLMGLGIAIVVRQHGWYWSVSRRIIRAVFRALVINPFRRFCRAYPIHIRWFIIGAVAAIGWKVLEAVLAIIGGLATVSGIWIGRFLAMTERHRYVCMALVFLAIFFGLCVSALFSAYYLFSRFGAP